MVATTKGGNTAMGHYEPEMVATFLPGCTACGAAQKGPLAGTKCAACGAPLRAPYRRYGDAVLAGRGVSAITSNALRRAGQWLRGLAERI